ncbi:MAG TPA: uracil-DNA glycosylase, partial [Gemmatimonadaceae bacterium]
MADARDQLRRYLEQRREMGESELMLDSLTVDDALRLLGARRAPNASASNEDPRGSVNAAPRPPIESAPSSSRRDFVKEGSGDWRETLRAAGASPASASPDGASPASAPPTGLSPIGASPPQPTPAEIPKPKIGRYELPAVAPSAASASPLSDVRQGLSVGALGAEAVGGSMRQLSSLEDVAMHVASCTRCALYATAKNPVPGEGNPNADLMCVGEAPGATEDETGRPFIGAAGQLLTKILEAIQLPREQVYICNVLKHRPPGNRNPLPEEVTACSPYLIRQIELVRPKMIIALGTFAAQTLLNTQLSLGKLRGQIHSFYGVPLIVTYHPAALL